MTRGGQFPGFTDRVLEPVRSDQREGEAMIHVQKMEYQLQEELKRKGLAKEAGEWLRMPPETAALFMIALAGEVGPLAAEQYRVGRFIR